jgi:hypothetical protein
MAAVLYFEVSKMEQRPDGGWFQGVFITVPSRHLPVTESVALPPDARDSIMAVRCRAKQYRRNSFPSRRVEASPLMLGAPDLSEPRRYPSSAGRGHSEPAGKVNHVA